MRFDGNHGSRISQSPRRYHGQDCCSLVSCSGNVSKGDKPMMITAAEWPKPTSGIMATMAVLSLVALVICLKASCAPTLGRVLSSCLLSPVSCLLSPVSCLLSPVSCLLSPVSCLLSPVSCPSTSFRSFCSTSTSETQYLGITTVLRSVFPSRSYHEEFCHSPLQRWQSDDHTDETSWPRTMVGIALHLARIRYH